MYKVIDIIEKKVPEKSTGIYVGEDYVGYTCVVMKKSNIKIEGKNLTIKDPSKGHKTIIKPHYPADGRITVPVSYKGEEVFVFIQDF